MAKHHGGCQCGAVRYTVEIDLEKGGATCNCSRCRRLGSIFGFVPKSAFTLDKGQGELTEYLFNKEVISHQFCKTCGIECFGFGKMPDGTETAAINLRTIDDVDVQALKTTFYDGAAA